MLLSGKRNWDHHQELRTAMAQNSKNGLSKKIQQRKVSSKSLVRSLEHALIFLDMMDVKVESIHGNVRLATETI